ncbi:MAG: choice-of-anchor D domain-containing protein [Pseudomonadota bacterium]|nr:choice-of-anchor D domain-containing protein [Pseudomonadota bacterium]
MNWIKTLLGAAGLLATTLLGASAATAATTVDISAQRASLTLPDGTVAPMWSYCGALDPASTNAGLTSGGACQQVAAGTLPAWTQGPTIVVPAGDTLTVVLSNALPAPTSLTILGQVGGGQGNPNYVQSPAHVGMTVTTFPNQAAATFKPLDGKAQPPRARSFVPEADGSATGAAGGSQTYVWNNLKPGTYLYESGSRPSLQVPMGLYGLLVVTSPQTSGGLTPQPGTPGVAYTAPAGAATVPLAYDADASFLMSEVDVLQNSAVDTAAQAMAASTAPTVGNMAAFSALEQRVMPSVAGNNPIGRSPGSATTAPAPLAQPNDPALPSCAVLACYPPAVNYAPTYFLLNGHSYDPSNPALNAQILSNAPGAASPSGRVLVRFANAGLKTHIPTIVGMSSLLVAEDGNLFPDVALAMAKTAARATPMVSGRSQSALLLPAAKTLDVVITPTAGNTAGTFVNQAYAVLDRELSLSGGGRSFTGLQGFLALAPAGTSAATLASVNGSKGGALLPNALAAAANPDTFNMPANASVFTGNVLANDVGISSVAASGTLPAGVTLNSNGRFVYQVAAGALTSTSFKYCSASNAALCATVSLVSTSTASDVVSAPAQTFTSRVASLIRVPHPGVLAGAASTGNYSLSASATSALPPTAPAPGNSLPSTSPTCMPQTGTTGTCTVQLFADGSFTATASAPGSYQFNYFAVDAQGVANAAPALAKVVFPAGSGVQVVLQDAVTGARDTSKTFLPGGSAAAPAGQDYRWVIEEDQTYLHDPGNPGFVAPAFPVPLSAIAMSNGITVGDGVSNQVTVTLGSYPPGFTGFVAGTYVQIQSNTDAFNGIFRINAVNGASFSYTLWQTPAVGVSLAATGVQATEYAVSGQSLATNFHRSNMPLVAAGCTGPKSCGDGETLSGKAATGAPRSLPSDVVLDPTKRYFISVLPGDAGATAFASGALPGGHTMGAAPVTPVAVGSNSWNPVTVLVPENPLPPAQMSFFVFEDNSPVSGDVDDGEPGLGGFEIVVYDTRGSSGDQAGQITYDLFNQPMSNALANQGGTGTDGKIYKNLCPTTPNGAAAPIGVIYTCLPVLDAKGNDISPFTGMALVKNMIPGRIDVQAHPAAWRLAGGEQWIQVSTLEGTPNNDAFTHPGEPAYWQEFGPPGWHSFIGFMNPAHLAAANKAAVAAAQAAKVPVGTVSGRITNLHMDRPPQAKLNDSCQPGTTDPACARSALNYTQCYVALNSQSGTGPAVAWAPCNSDGTFSIVNVPQDTYEMFIWDEWLDQIKAKQLVSMVTDSVTGQPFANGGTVTMGDIPVFNWFTRIQETIYVDLNGNGVRDPGEPGLPDLVANVRFRDGTFSNRLLTDLQGNATHNELFPLFNWYVMENDQTRYKNTGVHVIYDAGGAPDQKDLSSTGGLSSTEYFSTLGVLNSTETFPLPASNQTLGALYNAGKTERIDPPGVITEGMQGFINQTQFVEWGKQPFAPGENGGISGLVYYASVRAFDDPRLKVQNLSEPGIPRVTVNLYQRHINADGTTSDVLVDTTTSTSWDDWANGTTGGVPNMACPGNAPAAANPPAYVAGSEDPFINYTLGTTNQYKCYDGQHAFNQVQPAVYDGYYAFPTAACSVCTPVALVNNYTGAPMTNPDGTALAPVPTLPPGQYVVEVVRPDGFEITREEDKNILIGDAWISAAPQQFGNLVNMFILPDQATLNNNNPQGFGLLFPPCVGLPHVVPDYLTVVPEAQQNAPFAGQTRNLCDRKLVDVADQTASNADFQLWTPAPIAGHVTGLMLNDASAEFDPYSPSFGEKFALPNAPISVRDFNGTEVLRAYTDKWGTFDFMQVSTWEANVPNPSGYAPVMQTYCMNDPGPTPVPGQPGKFQIDPYYNQQYSDFCYNWPNLPGTTDYLDTPVLPIAAFAMRYAPVDCQYADLTPSVLRVDGNWVPSAARSFLPTGASTASGGVGPYVNVGAASPQLTITALGDVSVLNPAYAGPTTLPGSTYALNRITRHYGFGSAQGTVELIGNDGTVHALNVAAGSWSDSRIVATIPTGARVAVPLGSYQLVIVTATGTRSIDTVTVTLDNLSVAGSREPWYVAAPPPGTGIGVGQSFGLPHPIQDAIDSSKVLPGDLVIVDAGLYPELDVMWKPVRLQGVGAAAVTIQATKYPDSKIADWRARINLLFGLTPDGNQALNAQGVAYPTQVDPLPGQSVNSGIVRLEPTALSNEEGAGITVLAANNQADPTRPQGCLTAAQLAALNVNPEINLISSTPNGFFPVNQPQGGASAANQPVPATAQGRYVSDFACYASRIDGIGVTGSDAGGGIYVNGWAHRLQISNNRVFGNSGPYSGGVRIGQPYLQGQVPNPATGTLSYNQDVRIHHNAIMTNGTDEANAAPGTPAGSSGAGGGLAIEAGSDNFQATNNWICGNITAGDGGGLGVVGNSTPGLIQNNAIIFNEAYQQTGANYGGGMAIEGEPPAATGISTGVGNITVDSNLIQGNSVRSGSGGGVRLAMINGTEVSNTFHYTVTLSNNMIVNNVAGWAGGGVSLGDALFTSVWGNTIAHNDSVGTAGNLMNTRVNGVVTGPATAVPNPAGVASDLTTAALRSAIAELRLVPAAQPASLTVSQPEVMSNNIIWQNRSLYFDAAPNPALALAGVQLCSSNNWNDAVAHNCVPLAPQTAVGQCDTTHAAYWDVGVVGESAPATTDFVMDHSVLSVAYPGTGNTSADPQFAKSYCNGSRVNPGVMFEPGSPFLPNFGMNAAATLDEAGNFVDLQFGPLSLRDPGTPANVNGNYHLAGKAGSAFDSGATPSLAQARALTSPYGVLYSHDVDGNRRPQNAAYDIGAHEVPTNLVYTALLTAPNGQISSAAAPYSFGVQSVGVATSGVFTLANTGNSAFTLAAAPSLSGTNLADFAITANTCTANAVLAAGSSCAVTVRFTAGGNGVRGPVRLTINLSTPGVVVSGAPAVMTGSGPAPTATLFAPGKLVSSQTTPYSYASVAVGTVGSTQSFVYTNTGTFAFTLSPVAVTMGGSNATDFVVVAGSGTTCVANLAMAPGASCSVAVQFKPLGAGARSATLTVNTPAAAGVVNTGNPAYLAGISTAPTASLLSPAGVVTSQQSPWTFAPQSMGAAASNAVFTFSNTGTVGTVTLASLNPLAVSGSGFSLVSGAGTTCTAGKAIAVGASCTITVAFAPLSSGAQSGQLRVNTLASQGAVIQGNPAYLSGTGLQGVLALSVNPVVVSTTGNAGKTVSAPLTLRNSGNGTLDIAGLNLAAQTSALGTFTVSNGSTAAGAAAACPTLTGGAIGGTLAAGTTCSLTVNYKVVTTGANTSSLVIRTPFAPTQSSTVGLQAR